MNVFVSRFEPKFSSVKVFTKRPGRSRLGRGSREAEGLGATSARQQRGAAGLEAGEGGEGKRQSPAGRPCGRRSAACARPGAAVTTGQHQVRCSTRNGHIRPRTPPACGSSPHPLSGTLTGLLRPSSS